MKKYLLVALGLALLIGGPLFAEETAKPMMKNETRICKTHCDIHKLEDQIDAYKAQKGSADKALTKEALSKKIQEYQKMLDELNKKLEGQ
jgi:hypothetical protein